MSSSNSLSRTLHASEKNVSALALVGAWLAILLATAMAAFGAGLAAAALNFDLRPVLASMLTWHLMLLVLGVVGYVVAVVVLALRTLRGVGGQAGRDRA